MFVRSGGSFQELENIVWSIVHGKGKGQAWSCVKRQVVLFWSDCPIDFPFSSSAWNFWN